MRETRDACGGAEASGWRRACFLVTSDVYLLCLATGASDAKCPRVHQIVRAESSDAAVSHDGNGAGLFVSIGRTMQPGLDAVIRQ